MASRSDLTKQYMAYQEERKTDEMLAMLADDVTMSNPMTGTVNGKTALEQQMRNSPMQGGQMQLTWSEPEETGDDVKVLGSGSPFGTIKVVFGFNGDDQINKIDIGLA